MFDYRYMLIPVSYVLLTNRNVTFRVLYVFGIRVFYMTVVLPGRDY